MQPPKVIPAAQDVNKEQNVSRVSVQRRDTLIPLVNDSRLPGESTMSFLRKKKKLFANKTNRINTPDSKGKVPLVSLILP